MAYENNDMKMESIFSKRIKAGKRRTYFFDVRTTRSSDYYIVITESRKRPDDSGYDRHKVFLYKEDFNKFVKGLTETVDHIKTELMPDFDFDAYNHDNNNQDNPNYNGTDSYSSVSEEAVTVTPNDSTTSNNIVDSNDEVDKW